MCSAAGSRSTASTSASWISPSCAALFSLVLQDVHLFSGTIADNIRLGNAAITDEQVRDAARAVHADRFIERLPDGYEAPVAERGSTLSVGQKQLLSFARALAFDPRVLILDEATSSVDTETELLIRDALAALMAGRTTIAIAHRLSTIQDMDKILVLHKGVLREVGHAPGTARAARDLLQAVRAAVQAGRPARAAARLRGFGLAGLERLSAAHRRAALGSEPRVANPVPPGATGSGRDGSGSLCFGSPEDPIDEARRRRRGIPAESQHRDVSRPAAEPQRLVAAPHVDVDLAALDLRSGVEDACRCRRTWDRSR